MDVRIQQLVDRLPQLDETEKKLRLESNTLAYPAMQESGKVEMIVTDPARLKEIRTELEQISQERTQVEDKLIALSEALGPAMNIPSGGTDHDHIARLKAELGNFYFHKVLTMCHPWLLPEEALEDERYKTKAAELMPKIEEAEARIKRAEAKAEKAYAILNA